MISKEMREEVEAFSVGLHEKNWRSEEKDAIQEEFFLEPNEAEAVAEILKELEAEN